MKNRIQLLQIALAAFAMQAQAKGISVGPEGYTSKDTTHYLNTDLKGKGGTIDLVDANTKQIHGTTSLDGNKLAAGRHLIIDSVRALVENTETTFGAANWTGDAIAAVKGATLIITQEGEIFNIPMSDLFNGNSATGNGDDFRDIAHLPVIWAEKQFKMQLVFADGISVSNALTACLLRLEFRTIEVFVK